MARLIGAVAAFWVGASCGAPFSAHARPVSYEGGWTVIHTTNRQASAGLVHYTFTPRLSVGLRTDWDRKQDAVFNGVQATWLVKRWFGEDHQANLYVYGGAGAATGVGDNDAGTRAAALAGVMADWETRRLYVSYRARVLEGGAVDASAMQAARFGFAPYEGDTGDLHTWLMVEIDHRPDNQDPVGVTPPIRFFKGAALFEAGWSLTDNEPLISFTYRF